MIAHSIFFYSFSIIAVISAIMVTVSKNTVHSVFFLILVNNVLGLIPISANLTGNIAFTLVLSVVTLFVTNFGASGSYWKHIFLPKPYFLWFILMPIELVGVFSKPFALMIRLFANIAGGHIVV